MLARHLLRCNIASVMQSSKTQINVNVGPSRCGRPSEASVAEPARPAA